tara:strand:- start:7871 stop:8404 length:534 start_codon:yes stop_codon:yes gene_type:complete
MKVEKINLIDSLLITLDKFEDDRGFFMESYNQKLISESIGSYKFVQDNHSKSSKGVLRGLHYQIEHSQGKLVRCTHGVVYDVIVDMRKKSKTFGKYFGIILDKPELLFWVPPGFAHGFYTMVDETEFQYKTTDYYYPKYQKTLMWNSLNIEWPFSNDPILSCKDTKGETFEECEKYE